MEARTILQVKLDRRSIGYLAHPNIEILPFSRLEEENIVAILNGGEFVELVQLRLRVELGILAAMRKHRGNIVKKMTVSNCFRISNAA